MERLLILFDYGHRTIMLFDENKLKIKSLQVGNPSKSSLKFNVHIQCYNDFLMSITHMPNCLVSSSIIPGTSAQLTKMNYQIIYQLMKTYKYLYQLPIFDRIIQSLSNNTIEFSSFHIIWEDYDDRAHKESLNPYSTTFKQHVKDKLQKRENFANGRSELIYFQCKFDKCRPAMPAKMNDSDVLSHDIYKYLPHYPIIQVHCEIFYIFMAPYKRTISIERNNLPKSVLI
ncbi:hypothetical protein RFI_31809 [Reticulomyxa filosa]|uniref:Uncharacterized protein n=1 Tax=Reticulomyxa filosa TaxID=46433 RepID=X6LW35_RETFI|nr:hypothetical protein RFI_31809 [Reticulomyxa filosa]|eukprot:ETO05586.1 hypothetical protein RFI_31809 [Reticulomyxa filosa]